jgi:multiple sugar transport system permease protein
MLARRRYRHKKTLGDATLHGWVAIPALAVVAIYTLLLAWNDYLYPAVLLAVQNMTVAVTQGQLFADVDAEWNAMMAAAIIYVLPPIVLMFAFRRYVVTSLTVGEFAG